MLGDVETEKAFTVIRPIFTEAVFKEILCEEQKEGVFLHYLIPSLVTEI